MKRSEFIKFKGAEVHTNGLLPEVGSMAPDFTAVSVDLKDVKFSDYKGKRVILNIFPSLDTSVCATPVRRFNVEAAKNKNVVVLALSMDLPFAQSRFCTVEGVTNVIPLSLFRSKDFVKNYGVLMVDGPLEGLMARAVFAIDESGRIIYRQLVEEVTDEPDYASALSSLR